MSSLIKAAFPENHNWVDEDKTIAQLMECKPLSEEEVKKLCDKVD